MNEQNTQFVFDPVAARYDCCNHVFSLGIDRWWRKKLVNMANPHSNQRVLDVCTGTGDVAFSFLKYSSLQEVTGVDLSERMIGLAQEKQILYGGKSWMRNKRLQWKVADAVETAIESSSYDIVSCAFGIRNIPEPVNALAEAHRVLKPKGKLYILEFSLPAIPLLRVLYKFYLRSIMPSLGKIVIGSKEPLQYLAQSIQQFHTTVDLGGQIHKAGFRLLFKMPLTGGVATLWVAVKK